MILWTNARPTGETSFKLLWFFFFFFFLFQLEINDGSARNAETQCLLSGGRLGEIKTEVNTNRMYYGLLRDHDLTRILQHKLILASSTGVDNEDSASDDQSSTSKNRKKLKKDFFNQRQSKASLKVDPNTPQLT
ncbi:unnamed protein product [Rotaria sordida]|uniref:Uncharacterized protein n=1 Tax=Rotaria sordida TaxID=392033 RepID=A0A819N4K5_9BILA|nr:unnamed protein product [Rotaria sordida]CAF1386872.1 unnamed protein product [Rotaria sordida]CAF1470496.1 unnamed protein product [Rotaria sordida]CAF1602844.1 unnamed protein product [Rotaria sordida]CAF3988200.1 unnamed protein product [Rotaria sordida]